jgi:hypothetical protein
VTTEILVELEDFRTDDNESAKRPADEQALVTGAVVDRGQIMKKESPAVSVISPKPDYFGLFGFPCV